MTFYVEKEVEYEFPFAYEKIIADVASAVLVAENCPMEALCITTTITDDDGIHELNKEFRGIDKETDVLSFPNFDFETPGDFSLVLENKTDYYDPDIDEFIMGDIVLNVNRVRQQAAEYGHSELREFAFLVAHSMLHLCGYDHMEEDERIVMEEKQNAVLDSLGITRDI